MKGLCDDERLNKATQLLYSMFWRISQNGSALVRNIPSLAYYSAMAIDLYNKGRISEGNEVLNEMRVKGFWPSLVMYEAKLAVLWHSEIDVGYLKKMAKKVGCVANKETDIILVNGLCIDGGFVEASRVLEKMLI
ncbi:hypothetical protein QYF36_003067 [Acer negundo]|nr:hypothetical protein QYF36_003067 [Acer negundo]